MSNQKTLYHFIANHIEKDPVSFHMPGHKGSNIYKRFGYEYYLNHMMDFDITEISGADNLFQTEGVIRDIQEHYASLYGVPHSYLLINGTSGGNIASVLASVPKGKKLIMARNCHKSVFNALTLGQIDPIYAYPQLIKEYGIGGAVSPQEIQRLIVDNPDASAVLITSPNYYGICSDIKAIAEITHKYHKILIVDEAHGAHLHFSDKLPPSAVSSGADLVINSTHKTLASFTQSAVLHYNSTLVDRYVLEDKLQAIQSTSPSYLLMTSLGINAELIEKHGPTLMSEWTENLESFYQQIGQISGLRTMGKMDNLDYTKINFTMAELGLSGANLDQILSNQYDIYTELFTGDWIMAMTGIGNTKQDYKKLAAALEKIQSACAEISPISQKDIACAAEKNCLETPKQAKLYSIPKEKKRVKLEQSAGLICASSIIPYPPGIPLLCPGEQINEDAILYIKTLRNLGEKVIGINDLGEVLVGTV